MFSAPSIFIISGLFWRYLNRFRKRFRYKLIPVLIFLLLIILPVRYTIEKTKIIQVRERKPQWITEIKDMKALGKALNGKLVIFNTERPIETMFYVDCIAYPFIPDQRTISDLKQRGFMVLIH